MILERLASRNLLGYRRLLLETIPAQGLFGVHLPPTVLGDLILLGLLGCTTAERAPDVPRLLLAGQLEGSVEVDLDGLRWSRTLARSGQHAASLVRLSDEAVLAEGAEAVSAYTRRELGLGRETFGRAFLLEARHLEGSPRLDQLLGLDRLAEAAEAARAARRQAAERLTSIAEALEGRERTLAGQFADEAAHAAYRQKAEALREAEAAAQGARDQLTALADHAAAADAIGRALTQLEQRLLGSSQDALLKPAQSRLLQRYAQLHGLQRVKSREIGGLVDQVDRAAKEAEGFSQLRLEMDRLRNMVAVRGRRISRAIDPNPQRDRVRTDRQLLEDNLLLKIRAGEALTAKQQRSMKITLGALGLCGIGAVGSFVAAIGAEGALRSTLEVAGFCLILAIALLGWASAVMRRRQQATGEAVESMRGEAQRLDKQSHTCLHFNSDRLSAALTAARMLDDPEIVAAAEQLASRFPEAVDLPSINARHEELTEQLRAARSRMRQADQERATIEQLMGKLESQLPDGARLSELREAPGEGCPALPEQLAEEVDGEIESFIDAMRRRQIVSRDSAPPLQHLWETLGAAVGAFARLNPEAAYALPDLLGGLGEAERALDLPRIASLVDQLRGSIERELPQLAEVQQSLDRARADEQRLAEEAQALSAELGEVAESFSVARAIQTLTAEQQAVSRKVAAAELAEQLLDGASRRLTERTLPAVCGALSAALRELTDGELAEASVDAQGGLLVRRRDAAGAEPLTSLASPEAEQVRLALLLLLRQSARAGGGPRMLICERAPATLLELLSADGWAFTQAWFGQPAHDLPQFTHVIRPEQDGEALLWKGREDTWSPVR